MKLNFWQWLGIILLVLGAIGYLLYKEEHKPAAAPTATPPAAPATTVPTTTSTMR